MTILRSYFSPCCRPDHVHQKKMPRVIANPSNDGFAILTVWVGQNGAAAPSSRVRHTARDANSPNVRKPRRRATSISDRRLRPSWDLRNIQAARGLIPLADPTDQLWAYDLVEAVFLAVEVEAALTEATVIAPNDLRE